MTTIDLGKIKPLHRGAYSGATAYEALDFVTYNGTLYVAKQSTTGNLPTDTTYWDPVTDLAVAFHGATSKATPVDADELPLVDSAASFGLKKLTWANLKATLKTYFDSLTTTLTNKTLTAAILGGTTDVSGGQLKFPASQNASSDANTLDDYEEGTWTPTITFGGGNTGMTFNSRNGYYRKIGSLVVAQAYIGLSAKGSSTGAAKVEGLPFTVLNQTNGTAPASFWAATVTSSGMIEAYGVINSATVQLQQLSAAGSNANLTETNFSNTSEVMINLSYETA